MSTDGLYDLDAEEAVLACMFQQPHVADEIAQLVAPNDFQSDRHGVVFAACLDCIRGAIETNAVNVSAALKEAGTMERAGGPGAVTLLEMGAAGLSSSWARYAEIVRELAVRRRLVMAATNAIADARDQSKKLSDVLAASEAAIQAVGERAQARGPVMFRDALTKEWDALDALYQRESKITGVPSGLTELDALTAGFQKSHLIIVAGRPSSGKTAASFGFGMSAALSLPEDAGVVVMFSLEMAQSELVRRALSSEARIDGTRFRNGRFSESDWPRMANACDRIVRARMLLDDREGLTIHDMRSELRRARTRYGRIAMVVIDYLQIMKADADVDNRAQAVAALAAGGKRLAKEFECPVIALSQLNRGVESRTDKRPMMSDLKESGGIEESADVVILLYRDEYYDPNSKDAGIAELIIGKQRGGPTGTVRVAFDKQFTLFRDLPERSGY